MLLTISTTIDNATDLGYLLHKNPSVLHEKGMNFGRLYVFYPEATAEKCTAALLLEIDPITLVRGRKGSMGSTGPLEQYVNDRPYTANSLLSVAISTMFGTALNGRSKERQELADAKIPLEASLPCVPCREGSEFLKRLYEPLGFSVETTRLPLDEKFPDWGESPYYSVKLTAKTRLMNLLRALYILTPVLDIDKHYYYGSEEHDKLLAKGEGWLANHPDRDQIVKRYLRRRGSLANAALKSFSREEIPEVAKEAEEDTEAESEPKVRLNTQRIDAVLENILDVKPRRVIDLGCGEGKLIGKLAKQMSIQEIVGVDVSLSVLEKANSRLDIIAPMRRKQIELRQNALTYYDPKFEGFDVATLVEVIEHLDLPRLDALERIVFGKAMPGRVIVTTPNREYNVVWESLPAGKVRHKDHRFEWTRSEFAEWTTKVCDLYRYTVKILPIGPVDENVGSPTQMAVFDIRGEDAEGDVQ